VKGAQDTGDDKRVVAARARVEFRAGLVEQTQQALSQVAVVAQAPGQVQATLASLGQTVQAGVPAVRMQSAGWRASFELPRTLAARARKQGICAAEIEGRPVGCSLAVESGDETHVVIELPPEAATAAGQMVASAACAFCRRIPAAGLALSRVGEGDRVLLVAPTVGRVRSVVLVAEPLPTLSSPRVWTQATPSSSRLPSLSAGERVRTTEAMGE